MRRYESSHLNIERRKTEDLLSAGPFGLEVALSLIRQGVTFRIIGLCTFARSTTSDPGGDFWTRNEPLMFS